MVIDLHAHWYPRRLLDELAVLGSRAVEAVRGAPATAIELGERLALLDRAGIDRQVLSVGILQPDFTEREAAVRGARLANDLYATFCAQKPDRLGAFGALPMLHPDLAVAEIRRCLDELGMLGVTIGCSIAGRALDDTLFAPVFAELDRQRAIVLLHPVGAGTGPFTSDLGLSYMIGAPFEDTTAALRLILSGMLARYTRLRVIVPHLGGALPFLRERLELYVEAERKRGVRVPFDGPVHEQLERLWYDTVSLHPAALRCAVDSLGADRLVVGTDFPFIAGARFCGCVSYLGDAGLSARELAAIQHGNARALLGLEA